MRGTRRMNNSAHVGCFDSRGLFKKRLARGRCGGADKKESPSARTCGERACPVAQRVLNNFGLCNRQWLSADFAGRQSEAANRPAQFRKRNVKSETNQKRTTMKLLPKKPY